MKTEDYNYLAGGGLDPLLRKDHQAAATKPGGMGDVEMVST
jgi:hypothetical protein